MIGAQAVDGSWESNVRALLSQFFDSGELPKPTEEVETMEAGVRETVWATLVALYVLVEVFNRRESEWLLLAYKAKDCVEK